MDDNPLLDEVAKESYLELLSPDELDARKSGKPLAYGRRVYGHFDEKYHLFPANRLPAGWLDMRTPPKSWHSGYSLDIHPQTADAVLFTTVSPTGEIYFYDEIFERCTVKRLAELIKQRAEKIRLGWALCDPSAWNEDKDRSTWADRLSEEGIYVEKASKEKTTGIKQTQEIWHKQFHRRVYVMPHMLQFIKEIRTYFFDKENKPFDKNDHLMECLYRTYVHDHLTFRGKLAKDDGQKYSIDPQYKNPLGDTDLAVMQSIPTI
jgi:hypothetical protein